MIELLFDGRISPATRDYGKDAEYAQALQQTTEAAAVLRARLSVEDRLLMDVYMDCYSRLTWRTTELDFKEGFALAVALALDLYNHGKSDRP